MYAYTVHVFAYTVLPDVEQTQRTAPGTLRRIRENKMGRQVFLLY